MDIVVLLRYPRAERAAWKARIVELLENNHFSMSVIFGETSRLRHARAALKTYGFSAFQHGAEEVRRREPLLLRKLRTADVPCYEVADLNGQKSVQLLKQLNPRWLLLLGTGIIRRPVLEIPSAGTIHCHQGYLPSFRGVNTIEWSLFNRHPVCLSTHYVDPGIDTGDILLRKFVEIEPGVTISDVRSLCKEESVELIVETFCQLRDGSIRPQSQSAEQGRQYFKMHSFFKELVEEELQSEDFGQRVE